MRKSHLLIGLATSVLLASGAAAQQSEQGAAWPAFDQIDRDGDGILNQEEMQDVSGLEQQMDEDQITRQEYQELQQEEGDSQEGMETDSEDPELVPPETMEEMPEEGMEAEQ